MRTGLSYWAFEGYWVALRGAWAGNPVHYFWYKPDILDIFFESSLKYIKYT
jgi:phage terminase large subunit-like protein